MEVVQEVLLFESETWVLTSCMEKYFEGFHHRAVRRMVGMFPKCQWNGTCVYPLIGAVLATVGMDAIDVCIARHQNIVAQYIVTCHIMYLCLAAEQNPGLRLSRKCWEKPALRILGIREGHTEAEVGGGGGGGGW